MGGLLSRLTAKPSTRELLEDLEKEIEVLEEYKRSTEQQHKRVIGGLFFYFILIFIISAAVIIIYYYPKLVTLQEKVIYSIPVFAVPILFFALRKFLYWYFAQKLKKNEENLDELKKKRKSLLEHAMETETYKVVKELLQKFDPDYHKKVFELPAIEAPPPAPIAMKGNFGEIELKRRSPASKAVVPSGQAAAFSSATGPAPLLPPYPTKLTTNSPFPPSYLQRNSPQFGVRAPMQPMPRPVLKQERTLVDRMVDYLVGDGPGNRYALICRQCQSHNGMALKEEFEYVAFRCCYCFHWNPSRNQQPPPPRLTLPGPSSPTVVEPLGSPEVSITSADASDIEDSETKKVEEMMSTSQSGSESPSLRRRPVITTIEEVEEVNAVLEEDRTNYNRSDSPMGSNKG